MNWLGGESPEEKRQRRLAELLAAQADRYQRAMAAVDDALFELELQATDWQKARGSLQVLMLRLDFLGNALAMARGQVARAQVEHERLRALEARNTEGKR